MAKKGNAGSRGERSGVKEPLHLPHILTQCGLSSGQPAFPNLQADSPCACDLVISRLCILCPTGRAGSWPAHQCRQRPQSSWGRQLLALAEFGGPSLILLALLPMTLRLKEYVQWSSPSGSHLPSSILGISVLLIPLGSLPCRALILWMGDSPLELLRSVTLGEVKSWSTWVQRCQSATWLPKMAVSQVMVLLLNEARFHLGCEALAWWAGESRGRELDFPYPNLL